MLTSLTSGSSLISGLMMGTSAGASSTSSAVSSLVSGSGGMGSFQQVALQKFQERALEEAQKKETAMNEKYDAREAALDKQTDRYIKLQAQVNNARIAIENGVEGIEEIQSLLNDMRSILGDLEKSPDSDYVKDQWDEKLREINTTADMYGRAFNPIGKVQDRSTWEPNDITYNPNFTSTTKSLSGVYAGADFYIEADDGTRWVPDLGSNALEQYTSYNTDSQEDSDSTGKLTSLSNGVVDGSVNYDDSTGAISMTVIIDGEETAITGTMHSGGLELKGKWAFNDLSTTSDWDDARAALDNADKELELARSQMVANQAIIENDYKKISNEISEINSERKDVMYDRLLEEQALQTEFQQQVSAMQQNMSAMSQQQQSYLQVFASTVSGMSASNNPFFYNQTA